MIPVEHAVSNTFLLSFEGITAPQDLLNTLAQRPLGGVTLYRSLNIREPAQVCELTGTLQRAAQQTGHPPLLIAADQETGTLFAVPGTTRFPGNLALGATFEPELAARMGYAVGRELSALGININYAPVCDVISHLENPTVGTRSFGQDPVQVARFAAQLVNGLQRAGVAAVAKHFPGHGATEVDSHHTLPVISEDISHLRAVEFPPFAGAIQAGVKLVLTAHIALQSSTSPIPLPATLSAELLQTTLRGELGFRGVIISDALDMHALGQGPGLTVDAIMAARAGVDLLLLGPAHVGRRDLFEGLVHAARRGLLPPETLAASNARITELKAWYAAQSNPPSFDVVNCAEHNALADEIAAHALTLVRDEPKQLPLRLNADARMAVIVPRTRDLTPADTSSYETIALADALREFHPHVDEFVIELNPTEQVIAGLREKLSDYACVVIGTLNAGMHPGQSALVEKALASKVPTIVAALRMPHDLLVFPRAPTYLCAYSIQPCSLRALARVLFGQARAGGHLPVALGDLYPIGHGEV